MPDITITWTVDDIEYRHLQQFVAQEGAERESVEEYAARVGLKGLRGAIAAKIQSQREKTIELLTRAFDAASPMAKAAALDPLGYSVNPDGSVIPKP